MSLSRSIYPEDTFLRLGLGDKGIWKMNLELPSRMAEEGSCELSRERVNDFLGLEEDASFGGVDGGGGVGGWW